MTTTAAEFARSANSCLVQGKMLQWEGVTEMQPQHRAPSVAVGHSTPELQF